MTTQVVSQFTFANIKWIEIDLDAIASNFAAVRNLVGPAVQVIVCLKRNAMGCGALQVAQKLQNLGADGFALGNPEEAAALRKGGITLPILMYPGPIPSDSAKVSHYDLMPTISTLEDVEAWSRDTRFRLNVFLKIDAGGLRAGALPGDALAVAQAIARKPNLSLAGVYGHPMAGYGYDDDATFTIRQLSSFTQVLCQLDCAGLLPPTKMVASSSIVLNHPEADLNAIDPGRLLVGVEFDAIDKRTVEWRPAIQGLKTRLVMKKRLSDADRLERNGAFPIRDGMVIGLIPFGYGDGYPRKLPHEASVLIRGKKAKLLGPVHSELLRVDLSDIPEAELGDEVVLLGRSGPAEISLKQLSCEWDQSVTDVLSGLRDHIPRVYFESDSPLAERPRRGASASEGNQSSGLSALQNER